MTRLHTSGEIAAPSALTSTVERIPVTVYASSAMASKAVAAEIAELIRAKNARGENAVLGLATGSTPTSVYDELIRLHREEGLSFKNVMTFNLDEYWPMGPDALDHAGPGDADGRGQRLLRRVERAAQGAHDGRRDDPLGLHGRADGVGR